MEDPTLAVTLRKTASWWKLKLPPKTARLIIKMAISSNNFLYKRRPSSQHNSLWSAFQQIQTQCWMLHMMSGWYKASLLSTRDNTRDWCLNKMATVIASIYLSLRKMPCLHLLGYTSKSSAYEFNFVTSKLNGKLTFKTYMESRLVTVVQVTVNHAF